MSTKGVRTLRAANDNRPRAIKSAPQVVDNWPDKLPVTCAELDVLELYLGDIILLMAGNDNEPT